MFYLLSDTISQLFFRSCQKAVPLGTGAILQTQLLPTQSLWNFLLYHMVDWMTCQA